MTVPDVASTSPVVVAKPALRQETYEPACWVVLSEPKARRSRTEAGPPRVMLQVISSAVLVILAVALFGGLAARRLAEAESVDDARRRADLIAEAVLKPVLTDGLLRGDVESQRAVDRVVRGQILGHGLIRVKLWSGDGRILYSDEPRLIGQQVALGDEERSALRQTLIQAEVTDLSRPENRYERGRGKLLEAYRQVRTSPSGTPLLFETYSRYDEVSRRATQIWAGFGGLMVCSLLLLSVLQIPVLWRLLRRIRSGQEQREALLRRAVDASQVERRRIAGTLHDGVVQDLAATSFALAGNVERAEREGSEGLAAQLRETAATVRGSIGALRSLLVDIYPPSLASAGLAVALDDLAGSLRARDVDVRLDLPDQPLPLGSDGERLVYRVAHECFVNVSKHASATVVDVRLAHAGHEVVLDVVDDGIGFDVDAVTSLPPDGHLGLRVMADLAQEAGASLRVSSAPEEGTWWQLRIPVS